MTNIKKRPHNSSYPKGGVLFFADKFVHGGSSVLRMKFSGKNPALRVAAKRYVQLHDDTETINNLRTFFKILTFLWLVACLYIGVSMLLETPIQIAKDKEFIETKIKPSVDFVKNFKKTNGRLPNNKEYYTWQREYFNDYSNDLTQVDSLISGFGSMEYIRKLSDVISNDYDKFENVDWNGNFAIGVWRGEWTEYYFSWSDSYDSNDYSWKNSFLELIFMICIGVSPLFFWWLNNKSST